jgi:hypothetical protein
LSSSWASASLTLVSPDLGGVVVFPNPWRADKHAGKNVKFINLSTNVTVKIFTLSGHEAKSLGPLSGSATWDLTDNSNDKVASGLYLYLITDSSGNKVKGKLAVIR